MIFLMVGGWNLFVGDLFVVWLVEDFFVGLWCSGYMAGKFSQKQKIFRSHNFSFEFYNFPSPIVSAKYKRRSKVKP